jgi:hypothetical protein
MEVSLQGDMPQCQRRTFFDHHQFGIEFSLDECKETAYEEQCHATCGEWFEGEKNSGDLWREQNIQRPVPELQLQR